jgi:hypothetical protein
MVIEEGVKEIMLGVLCALGISCSTLGDMRISLVGGKNYSYRTHHRAPSWDTVMTMNHAKPDETFEAALNKTSFRNIRNPEMRNRSTDLITKEIVNWFKEHPKAADRMKTLTGTRKLKDYAGNISETVLNWGPEPEYGWPGWNEVMKEVERAIAQPK